MEWKLSSFSMAAMLLHGDVLWGHCPTLWGWRLGVAWGHVGGGPIVSLCGGVMVGPLPLHGRGHPQRAMHSRPQHRQAHPTAQGGPANTGC